MDLAKLKVDNLDPVVQARQRLARRRIQQLLEYHRDRLPVYTRAEQRVVDDVLSSWELFGRVSDDEARRLLAVLDRAWPRAVR